MNNDDDTIKAQFARAVDQKLVVPIFKSLIIQSQININLRFEAKITDQEVNEATQTPLGNPHQ